MSEFYQFPSVSGLFVEPAELEAVVGELLVRRVLPFGVITAEDAFHMLRRLIEALIIMVDDPCQPAVRRVGAQSDAFAGVRISDEKRMLVALVDSDGLDGDVGVGFCVKCGEHFLFLSGFPFGLLLLIIQQAWYEINFGVSRNLHCLGLESGWRNAVSIIVRGVSAMLTMMTVSVSID